MSATNFLISNFAQDINHEETLKHHLKSAKLVKIISPFITMYGVDFVLNNVSEGAQVEIITELTIPGILHGSQSPACLKKLKDNSNCNIYYYTGGLHSKVYILDENLLVTSANLTQGGLKGNFESGLYLSSFVKESISIKLKESTFREINAYWSDLAKKGTDLDDADLQLWLDKEKVLADKKQEYLWVSQNQLC